MEESKAKEKEINENLSSKRRRRKFGNKINCI